MGIFGKKEAAPLPEKRPDHIAFIMDGNGRWAKKRGLPRAAGHIAGVKVFRNMVTYCREIGIPYITFYAFSTENWKRSEDEVSGIMKLFREELLDLNNYLDKRVRMVFIGDKSAFAPDIRNSMLHFEEITHDFERMTTMLAANYGGRDEITHACREIAREVADGKLSPDDITEKTVQEHLYTAEFPDVDLLIRPSGEQRISNFLLWQCAYAEFYFSDVLWPDFNAQSLNEAITEYSRRSRRFGGV